LLHMAVSARYCFEDFDVIEPKAAKKNLRPVILEPIKAAREQLAALPEWTKEAIAKTIGNVAASFDLKMGKVGQPIRVAVTGGPISPPIDVTVWLVGRERTLKRLDNAIELIAERAAANPG
jgi:glutamyl-tRNA synthetase